MSQMRHRCFVVIKLDTRTAIIEAAFDVLTDNPGATLQDIAARAGVGRATLHRHFEGRADLVLEMARLAARELDQAIDAATAEAGSCTQALQRAMEAMIPLARRQWFLANEPLDQHPELAQAYHDDLQELAGFIDKAKDEGTFDLSVPTPWIVETYEALTWAAWAQVRKQELTPKQAAALAWRTLTAGLSGDAHDQ